MIELLADVAQFFVAQVILGYGIFYVLFGLLIVFIASVFLVIGIFISLLGYDAQGVIKGVSLREYTKKKSNKTEQKIDRRLAIEYACRSGGRKCALTSDWSNKYLQLNDGSNIKIRVVPHKHYDEIYIPSISHPFKGAFIGYLIGAVVFLPFWAELSFWIAFVLVSIAVCLCIALFFVLLPKDEIPEKQGYNEALIVPLASLRKSE